MQYRIEVSFFGNFIITVLLEHLANIYS